MLPLAPEIFSTITPLPQRVASLSATMRAPTSGAVPAGKPTRMRAVVSGELVCANAPELSSNRASARIVRMSLLRLDVRCLDDRPPFLDLGLLVSAERLRGLLLARRNLQTDVGKPLAHRRIGERIHHGGIELRDGILRRALRHPQRRPE